MSNVGPNIVAIGGKEVDINDPCSLCQALQAYRVTLATGGVMEEMEIRSPLTNRRVRFAAGSKAEDLDKLIEEARQKCLAVMGQPTKRTRYAMRGAFRPY